MELRDRNGLTEAEFLAQYDASKFERPSVTVDIILTYKGRILLIKRGGHPALGKYAMPGGFVEMTETVEQAAVRELTEETGISSVAVRQLRVWSQPDRDPRTRIITVAFAATFTGDVQTAHAGDDADDAGWFEYSLMRHDETGTETERRQVIDISLRCGEKEINYSVVKTTPILPFECDSIFTFLTECPLAGDHGLIIADALDRAK